VEIYIVGGAVRDKLLKRKVHDIDRVVVGATKEEFLQQFPNASLVGKSFPVFLVNGAEYAFARFSTRNDSDNSVNFSLDSSPEVSLNDDLYRRDITINAMAINSADELIDPYNGAIDLKLRVLRHVSDYFADDPLRVFRVARFAATLEFEVAPETVTLMKSLKPLLANISGERIFLEMQKALMAESPRRFFDALRQADVLEYWFSPIHDLIGVEQPEKWHPEGDAYEHTMCVLDKVEGGEARFIAICHDLGKGVTDKHLWPHHYDHDKLGEKVIIDWCSKLQQVPGSWEKKGKIVSKLHMKAKTVLKPKKILRIALEAQYAWDELKQVMLADAMVPENTKLVQDSIRRIEIAYKVIEQVKGVDVISKWPTASGKQFSERLNELRINELLKQLNDAKALESQ